MIVEDEVLFNTMMVPVYTPRGVRGCRLLFATRPLWGQYGHEQPSSPPIKVRSHLRIRYLWSTPAVDLFQELGRPGIVVETLPHGGFG